MKEKIILANLVDENYTVAIPASKILSVEETEFGCFITLAIFSRKKIGYSVVESLDHILSQFTL